MKPRLKKSLMIFLTSTLIFSGCVTKTKTILCGVEDYLPLPKETRLVGVPLNLEGEQKSYDVVLSKEGAFYSVDCAKHLFKQSKV